VLVVVVGLMLWPQWSELRVLVRVTRLGVLIGTAGLAYSGVLFATGFRLRDLHAR
jgi:putative peptidoglycan lipid II flippase